MNDERQFRFLVPPFFFGLSVLGGVFFSGVEVIAAIGLLKAEHLAAIIAALGAAILPIGFLLTSISIITLRLLGFAIGKRTYEVVVPEGWLERIWPLLRTDLAIEKEWLLYAAATFDHELLPAEIHAWIQRRWSAFHTAAHSAIAVIMSHAIIAFPSIRESCQWLALSAFLVAVLSINAFVAWRHVMRMIEFQSHRRLEAPLARRLTRQSTRTLRDKAAQRR